MGPHVVGGIILVSEWVYKDSKSGARMGPVSGAPS